MSLACLVSESGLKLYITVWTYLFSLYRPTILSLKLTIVYVKFNFTFATFHEQLRIYKSQADLHNLDILIEDTRDMTGADHLQDKIFNDVKLSEGRPIIVKYTKSDHIVGGKFWIHISGEYF